MRKAVCIQHDDIKVRTSRHVEADISSLGVRSSHPHNSGRNALDSRRHYAIVAKPRKHVITTRIGACSSGVFGEGQHDRC